MKRRETEEEKESYLSTEVHVRHDAYDANGHSAYDANGHSAYDANGHSANDAYARPQTHRLGADEEVFLDQLGGDQTGQSGNLMFKLMEHDHCSGLIVETGWSLIWMWQ
jgi:hypothetical protein